MLAGLCFFIIKRILRILIVENLYITTYIHCVKSFRIRSYSGPYLVRMRENTDQNNSEYGHFYAEIATLSSICGGTVNENG